MNYRTKQNIELINCLKDFSDRHVTVPMIADYLRRHGSSIGIATIYRNLDKLEKEGLIRKYVLDGKSCACYQFINQDSDLCVNHYHLKCEKCGKLIHLECAALGDIDKHITEEHGFKINSAKTVFYGICGDCGGK